MLQLVLIVSFSKSHTYGLNVSIRYYYNTDTLSFSLELKNGCFVFMYSKTTSSKSNSRKHLLWSTVFLSLSFLNGYSLTFNVNIGPSAATSYRAKKLLVYIQLTWLHREFCDKRLCSLCLLFTLATCCDLLCSTDGRFVCFTATTDLSGVKDDR